MASGEIYTTAHLNFFLFKAAAFFAGHVREAEFVWLDEKYSKEEVGELLSPFLTNKLQREIAVDFGDEKEVKEFFELAVSLLAHELAEENLDSNVPDRALLEALVVQMLAKQESDARLSSEIKELQKKFLETRLQLARHYNIPEEQVSGLEAQEKVAEGLGFAKAPVSPLYVHTFIKELPAVSREINNITHNGELDEKIIKHLAVGAAEILPPSLNGRTREFFEKIYQKTETAVLAYSRQNPDKQITLDQALEINKAVAVQYSAQPVPALAPEYLRDEAAAEAETLISSENPASFAPQAYLPPTPQAVPRPEAEIKMETAHLTKEAAGVAAEFFVGALTDEAKSTTEAKEIGAQSEVVYQEILKAMKGVDFRQSPRSLREQELRDLLLVLTDTYLGKRPENYALVQQIAGEIFPEVARFENQIDEIRAGAVKAGPVHNETQKLQVEIYSSLLSRNVPFATAQAMAYQLEAFLDDKITVEETVKEIEVLKRDLKEIVGAPEMAALEAEDRAYLQTLPGRYAELVLVQSLVGDLKKDLQVSAPMAEPATVEAELRYLLENLKTDELEKFRDKLVFLKNQHPEFGGRMAELIKLVDEAKERQAQREIKVKAEEEKRKEEIRIEQAKIIILNHELIVNLETLKILAGYLTPEQIDDILRTNHLELEVRKELTRISKSLVVFRRDNGALYHSARADSRGRPLPEIPPEIARQMVLSLDAKEIKELQLLIASKREGELRAFYATRLTRAAALTGKYPESGEQKVRPSTAGRLSGAFTPLRNLGRIPVLRRFWDKMAFWYTRLLASSPWGAAVGALAGGGLVSQVNVLFAPIGALIGAGLGGAGGGVMGRASGQNVPNSVGNLVNRGKNAINNFRRLANLARTIKKLVNAAKIAAILANPANWPVIGVILLLLLLFVFFGPIYAAVSAFLNTLPQFRKVPTVIRVTKTASPSEMAGPQTINYSIVLAVPEIEQITKGKKISGLTITDNLLVSGGNLPADFNDKYKDKLERIFTKDSLEPNKPENFNYIFNPLDPTFQASWFNDSCIKNYAKAEVYIEGVGRQAARAVATVKIGNPKTCEGDYPSTWPVEGCITRGPNFASHTNAEAVDFGKSNNNEVFATHDGIATVVLNGMNDQGYGNYVKIVSPLGFASIYAHLADGSLQVASGQKVSKGDILGKVDQTGTGANGPKGGPHLHYQFIGLKMDPPNIPLHIDSKDFDTTPCLY